MKDTLGYGRNLIRISLKENTLKPENRIWTLPKARDLGLLNPAINVKKPRHEKIIRAREQVLDEI